MNKRQVNIILIVLAVVFGFASFYIYKANKVVGVVSKFNDTVLNLMLLDNELSFSLENNVFHLNYDDVNKNLRNFDQNLSQLDELNRVIQILHQEKNAKFIKNIQDSFAKKQRLIDRSNFASSSMASYILSGEHEIDSDKKLEPLDPIFHAIRSSAIISNEALDITKEQMERFKTTYKNDAKATSILEKASYALGFAKSLSNIAKDSADIKLGEILRNFRKREPKIIYVDGAKYHDHAGALLCLLCAILCANFLSSKNSYQTVKTDKTSKSHGRYGTQLGSFLR